jgi:isoleucyl-tRNA synthetase
MAPDHGEDDFALCKAHGIEPKFAVTADGKYREDWGWLGGQGSVINPKFNAPDGPICSALADVGALMAASADYKHSYPHSWRSKAKVIYRCTPQWFVPMDQAREGGTLREKAVAAIAATRFVPEKGRNRIGAMVEGRPDWVLSRQRAWGVPITLFVNRQTGQYLADPEVNARIIAGVMAEGVDAWDDERAQQYLGDKYQAEDYERVTDILDVWFDPVPPMPSCWNRAAGPNCAGRPISISKAATSIAAGSSPRCWNRAPRAAVRLMTRS